MRLAAAAALVLASACAQTQAYTPAQAHAPAQTQTQTQTQTPALETPVDPHGSSPHGSNPSRSSLPRRLVDGKSGGILEPESVFSELLSARAIYISEQHTNPHHHAAQLSIIAGLYAKSHSLAIGMEMFKRPFQAAIDRYLAGEIDEEALLKQTEWDDRWGYSFDLYRPILEFARAHHVPVRALNAPDEITRAVATGGLSALSPDERASLPDLDLSDAEHKAQMREVFEAHHASGARSFDDFYAAQVIWDETMAYEVAKTLNAPGGPERIVVLAGDGHIRSGLGIPKRAARRGASPFKTVLPMMLRDLEETVSEAAGDYLWVMAMSEADLAKL